MSISSTSRNHAMRGRTIPTTIDNGLDSVTAELGVVGRVNIKVTLFFFQEFGFEIPFIQKKRDNNNL